MKRDLKSLSDNPTRQVRAAVSFVCVAAAAAALPVASLRAGEQRGDAEWQEKAKSFSIALGGDAQAWADQANDFFAEAKGWRARAVSADHSVLASSLADLKSIRSLQVYPVASMTQAKTIAKEHKCLSQAVYYEARGESVAGQMAVAEVVLNRVTSKYWPNTVCGVVFEGSTRKTGCQFSFTCDGSLRKKPYGQAWRQAEEVAAHALLGFARPMTANATHYHTVDVNPVWSASLTETRRVGAHIFYRLPSSAERARMRSVREADEALVAANLPLTQPEPQITTQVSDGA